MFVFYGKGTGSGISSAGVQAFHHTDFGFSAPLLGQFGSALAAGDLLGSTQEELAIGAPLTPVNGMAETGRV